MTVKTVIFVLLFTETSFIYPIFVHVLFRVLYPEKRMKRESGESPGQSRCCKLLCKGLFTTSGHCFLLFEKVGRHNKPE